VTGAACNAPVRAHARALIGVAERALDHGLLYGAPPLMDPGEWPEPLREMRASFVTLLTAEGRLRGCIGTIDPHRPLVADINANAFAAAFKDPRFPPLRPAERSGLYCELSILTPPEPMAFADETDIIERLRPGVDGVLIEAGTRRGTLLPAVWEQLPDPMEFWRTLKEKAGIDPDILPADLAVYRYRADRIAD
jgi:AmmeMemoRadiSam system protein A